MKRRKTKKIIPCVLSGMMILSGFTQYVYADEVENSTVVIEETPSTNVEVRDDSSTAGTDSAESNETTTDSPSNNENNKDDSSNLESSESKEDTSKKDETSGVDTNQNEKHDGIESGTTSTENKDSNQNNDEDREDKLKQPEVENKVQASNSNTSSVNKENRTEQAVKEENQNNVTKYSPATAVPSSSTVNYGYNDSYVDTWYHPTLINALGYTGEVKNAIKLDNYVTGNWNQFTIASNPFQRGQCTYFAWSRFYQVYGYDSGARGNGKTNAAEIVKAHGDQFKLSSTPAAGAVFSYEKNSLLPQYGHVGFVEAYDEETDTIYISEGNVTINGTSGNIYIHKMKFSTLKQMYPDIVFAVPNQPVFSKIEGTISNKKAYGFKKKARRVYTKAEWKRIKASVNKNLHKI